MRILASGEGEGGMEVGRKLINLLAGGNKLLINLLLELKTSSVDGELLQNLGLQILASRSVDGEEAGSTLALLGSLGLLEGGVSDILHINAGDIDLGGGGNDVGSSDATQGDTVVLVGARDEKKAALKTLQEDSTAASKATSDDDDDCARSQRLAESRELHLLLLSSLASAALSLSLDIALHAHIDEPSIKKQKKLIYLSIKLLA